MSTTTTPGCERTLDALDDYVDGALDEAAFQEVELHLSGCTTCADEHRLLREILRDAAALPRSVAPPRDLWPGIADRLVARRPQMSRWTMGLAAAAALAMAVTMVTRRAEPDARPPAATPVAAATEGLPPALEQAEAEYARATAQLMAAIEARRGALPPRTVAALEQNLKTIDAALAEVRTALRSDPSNPHLNLLLASTHQRKVEVLRQVVRLTT
jgi:anti-sigma factor RsiW